MTGVSEFESAKSPEFVVLMSIICVIAVVLNLLVIYVVARYNKFRSSVDIFITNLAISDIIHAGIVHPVQIRNTLREDKNFYGDDALCKVIMVVPLLIVLSAIYTIVTMAIDRYRAVVKKIVIGRKTAIYAVLCIWAFSFIVSSPQIYEYSLYLDHEENNETYISCGSEGIVEHFETVYAAIVVFLAYLIPLGLVIGCYTGLCVYVHRNSFKLRTQMNTLPAIASGSNVASTSFQTKATSQRNQTNATSQSNQTLSPRMIKIVKMLMSLTITFLIMWTPYFVIFAINMFRDIVRNWLRCFRKVDARVTDGQTSQTRHSNTNKVTHADSMKVRELNTHSLENIK